MYVMHNNYTCHTLLHNNYYCYVNYITVPKSSVQLLFRNNETKLISKFKIKLNIGICELKPQLTDVNVGKILNNNFFDNDVKAIVAIKAPFPKQ